jgi:rubredoxin/NAD-dependent dihydropyrimidine dehydrogenase PreA subunit
MVDDKKRTFLKHLGLVGAAGALGVGVSYLSSTPPENLIDDLQDVEQARGYRKVWATKRDEDNNYGIVYAAYLDDAERLGIYRCDKCGYIYDVTAGRERRFDELPPGWVCTSPECAGATKDDFVDIGIGFRTGGQPLVNEVVCAFHFDENGDGKYEKSEKDVFCHMPCKAICPVDAITEGDASSVPGEVGDKPKRVPVVDFDSCIRCGRCHKICGYNSIEWVNKAYTGSGVGGAL